jgi:RNA polymerase sigma factor (sigma-70 family)
LQLLLERLNTLPDQYREVILLAKFEGLTTMEISERLGKSRENVALLLHRGLKRFKGLDGAAK